MIYNSSLWMEDLNRAIDTLPELNTLNGTGVFITGASGLICSAVCDLLIQYNETKAGNIRIYAAGRNKERMADRFSPFFEKEYFCFVPYDATKPENQLPDGIDYIIHGGGNAFPKMIAAEPVETMLSNFNGLYELLSYAKQNGVKRLAYISSSEVYGKKENNKPFDEDEYGYIDLLNARNSYSVGKRAAETLCASFYAEYGVDSVLIRPGHIYGPTATKNDNRISSAWAYDVANGKDIVMKSDGSQIRSYVYCVDSASAILKALLKGESVHAYNISNPNSIIDIKTMAGLLAESSGSKLLMDLPTEEERKAFNPMSNSSLNSDSLLALGWTPCFDAKTGFEHTVKILQEGER